MLADLLDTWSRGGRIIPDRFGTFTALSFIGACTILLLLGNSNTHAAPPRRPNIVLIVADDLGWADLACYGADLHETPHLDRLATGGVRFSQAYAAAPVCTPTRAALLTGKHPARLHMTIWREAAFEPPTDRALIPPVVRGDLSFSERTLAEALHDVGYLTAHVGKWHLGDAAHFPETHGFDVHIGGNHWGAPATHFFPYRVPGNSERRYVPGLPSGREGEYLADRLTDEAIKIIDRAGDQPFFLNLWHYSVHTPIEAKPASTEHFRTKLRPDFKHQNPVFAAMVENLDENIGLLLRHLEESGLAQNTIVIFTSDNGGYINAPRQQPELPVTNNAPLRSGKGSLYEGGIRVPLIIRWPGHMLSGSECHEPVVSTDLNRTVLEVSVTAARLDESQLRDAVSIAPLLNNPQGGLARDALYWHYPHYYPTSTPCSAIRQGDWKLVEFFETQKTELYNLRNDLGESRDVSADNPEITKSLRERLRAWRSDVEAQMPTANTNKPAG